MAVNFPNNPALNSTHTEAGYTWTWDGTSWTITGGSLVDFLNEVGDVNAPAPITDGHILKYDSTNSQWVPSPDTGGSGGGAAGASIVWDTQGNIGEFFPATRTVDTTTAAPSITGYFNYGDWDKVWNAREVRTLYTTSNHVVYFKLDDDSTSTWTIKNVTGDGTEWQATSSNEELMVWESTDNVTYTLRKYQNLADGASYTVNAKYLCISIGSSFPNSSLVLEVTSDGEGSGGGSGVPVGTIAVWSGETTNIPTGWALCDGTNGTPDLRNRFIIGAGVSGATTNYITQITGTAQEGALENVFDGDLNTFALPNGEGANGITFSPTDWTTANSVTSLRIYCTRYPRTNDTSGKLWVNGVDYTAGVDDQTRAWTTISETDIQTIRWDKTGADGSDSTQNSYVVVFAIEVNGVVLTLPQYKSTGETGGSADAILPLHQHGTGGAGGGTIHAVRRGSDAMIDAISHEVSANDAHYDTTSVTDPAGVADGNDTNLPPYYALCYIMCTVITPVHSSLSVTQQPAQGTGALTYSSFNGVFQYTPPALNQTDWDAAYAWGDHSQVGYLTTLGDAAGVTAAKISNWDTAYGWGDHSNAGYVLIDDSALLDLTRTGSGSYIRFEGESYFGVEVDAQIQLDTGQQCVIDAGGQIQLKSDTYIETQSTYVKFKDENDTNTLFHVEATTSTWLYYNGNWRLQTLDHGIKVQGSLSDKNDSFGSAGQVLSSDGTNLEWITLTTGGGTLASLTDTQILSQQDGDVLTWDDTAQLWKPQAGGGTQVNADWNANFGVAQILNKPTTIAGYGITDAFDGDYGSLTNIPTNFIVDGDFTTAGLMKTDGSGGYSIVTDDSSTWNSIAATVNSGHTNWDEAYNWGDHAQAGYATSDTDTQYTLGWAHGTNNTTALTLAPVGTGTSYTVNLIGGSNITFTGSGSNLTIDSGGGSGGGDIPPSTRMLFYMSSAPTGWTKVTDQNDKAIRVVSGSGGGSGGNVNFSSAMQSKSVSGSVSGNVDYDNTSATSGGGGGMNVSLGHSDYSGSLAFSGATSNHTLVSGELPAHSHNFHRTRWATAAGGGGDPGAEFGTMNSGAWSETNTQNHGSGVGHNHDFAWVGANHRHTLGQINLPDHTHSIGYNHRHGISLNINGNNIDMNIKYIDVIICSKD